MRPTPYFSVEILPFEEKSCCGGGKVFEWTGGDLWPRSLSAPGNLFPEGFIPKNFPAGAVVNIPVDPNPGLWSRAEEWSRLMGAFGETREDWYPWLSQGELLSCPGSSFTPNTTDAEVVPWFRIISHSVSIGEPLTDHSVIPIWRRCDRAWLERPLRFSKNSPQNSHRISRDGSLSWVITGKEQSEDFMLKTIIHQKLYLYTLNILYQKPAANYLCWCIRLTFKFKYFFFFK